ncbi:hypothetical protein BDV98DRAFT_484353, partial [Pterulicium gracile]
NDTFAVAEWLAPAPPSGSDAHRYVVLLYKQPSNFSDQSIVIPGTPPPILNFDVATFAAQVGLGEPVGGMFF